MIFWLTGKQGTGKTNIAKNMCHVGHNLLRSFWFNIDEEEIRDFFNNYDFTQNGYEKNVEYAQILVQYLHKKGYNIVVSLVSPNKDQRDNFKEKFGDNFVEVYVHNNQENDNELITYEPPSVFFVDICTTTRTIEDSANTILSYSF